MTNQPTTEPTSQQPPPSPHEDLTPEDLTVEAALFSSGRPLSAVDLAEQTGIPKGRVQQALEHLAKAYRARTTALDIVKSGEKYALALTADLAEQTRHIVPPEVPRHVLRTLALVAYHQPILQSDLKDMVGSKVYEHVGILHDLGLIRKRPDGLTYRLTTTEDFPEYFAIPSQDPERIRRYLAEKVGLVPKQDEREPHLMDFDNLEQGDDEGDVDMVEGDVEAPPVPPGASS
ncbi:MAG: SMC-Scp complex subunit ScpB [Candidatus Thermoplasmatota archaeon]|nr:SMC-Scp complex subunit ScpB [Candidatus Thermoplasmatota archaeon]